MVGTPPSSTFAEPGLDNVRHFRIPRLADEELAGLTQRSAHLGELLGHAPASLRDLLKNVFNLSIASELIAGGTTAASIGTIATQSELLEEYEDQRLSSIRLQTAVADSVKAMIDRRRLTVRKVDIRHEQLQSGAGRLWSRPGSPALPPNSWSLPVRLGSTRATRPLCYSRCT
jgi:hypothetical protein